MMNSLEKIEEFAKENYVPIARKQTIEFLKDLFIKNNYRSFLEIGTAIGYTSINIALLNPNIRILTLEYEEKRANIARQNFIDFNVDKQIQMILCDARFYYPDLSYDLIFICSSYDWVPLKYRPLFYILTENPGKATLQ